VDAHADVVVQRRLLVVAADQAVAALDDPEVDLNLLNVHGHGQQNTLLAVKLDELDVVQHRQHVPVHGDKDAVEIKNDAQNAGRAERLVLPMEAQLERLQKVRGLQEIDLNQLPQVAHAQIGAGDAGR